VVTHRWHHARNKLCPLRSKVTCRALAWVVQWRDTVTN